MFLLAIVWLPFQAISSLSGAFKPIKTFFYTIGNWSKPHSYLINLSMRTLSNPEVMTKNEMLEISTFLLGI